MRSKAAPGPWEKRMCDDDRVFFSTNCLYAVETIESCIRSRFFRPKKSSPHDSVLPARWKLYLWVGWTNTKRRGRRNWSPRLVWCFCAGKKQENGIIAGVVKNRGIRVAEYMTETSAPARYLSAKLHKGPSLWQKKSFCKTEAKQEAEWGTGPMNRRVKAIFGSLELFGQGLEIDNSEKTINLQIFS